MPSSPGESRRTRPPAVSLRQVAIALVIGVLAAIVTIVAGRSSDFLGRVENASYDWRVRRTATPLRADSPIVIVDINESSVRALEPLVGRWPWPRAVHAALVDYLARAGARVVAFDILFGEREGFNQTIINGQPVSGAQSDEAFITSLRGAGNVILLAGATYEGLASDDDEGVGVGTLPGREYQAGEGWLTRPDLQLPFPALADGARGIGHNLLVRDRGSDFARRMLPFIDVGGHTVPSLGLAAALAYLDTPTAEVALEGTVLRAGTARVPLLVEHLQQSDGSLVAAPQALLRFQAPVTAGDSVTSMFPGVSVFDVLLSADQLAAGQAPAVPPDTFRDKLVFVGTSAAGTFDRYLTPFPQGAGGVELHATLAENVLSGRFMRRAAPALDWLVVGAMALAAALAAALLPVAWATVLVAVLCVAVGYGLTRLVGDGLWVAAVTPALAAGAALFGGVGWQYFVEGREKRHIKQLFGRFVSKDVIEELMADPARARLGGQRREMTVLFSDIRGFTTASEAGTPEDVVTQLNEYFGAMVEVLFRHQGTLDKFVGDMVMGLFGAPLPDPDHADHAVAASLEMVEVLGRLNARWKAEGRPPLDIGIGVNTGEMIAGNIGAESAMSYTVIGDAVNLGARLESLNKEYGTRILISGATLARLERPVQTREIGAVKVKGKTKAVVVHQVIEPGAPLRGEGTTPAPPDMHAGQG